MKRFRVRRYWFDLLDWAALWATVAIVVIEMFRLIIRPTGSDAVVLVLAVIVLLNTIK